MALLLAPYNDAMRLGMGFNSFTQQLCINDAVRTKDNQPVSEKLLRPQYKLGTMTALDGGNVDISQDVTWTAKFVDRISEVTDSMNISGSLQIKCDAIGGSASASFLDTNKFKESDINYLITVKVTNQYLAPTNLTEFCPIKYLPPSEFTRVYGDSFISGFTEGGEFNALVSIKLKDRSQTKDIRGKLKVELDFKAVSVAGEGELSKQSAEKSIDGETTITVSWKGGGDIKDGTVMDWTLETLKSVAMEFPEHVMACPMRTNAILTKYTALKSFYETQLRGSPLDYENAGVYASALLDAYMDYKVMWRNIQTAAWEVENGQSELLPKPTVPELVGLAQEAQTSYQNQVIRYKQKLLEYESEQKSLGLDEGPQASVVGGNVPSADSHQVQQGTIVSHTAPDNRVAPTAGAPTTDVATTGVITPHTDPSTTGPTPAPSSNDTATGLSGPLPPSNTSSTPTGALAATTTTVSATTPAPSPAAVSSSTPSRSTVKAPYVHVPRRQPPEPPMPPNSLVPYNLNIFGLDKARRDCRFEMIKIVREVDAVTEDPKVATDPDRAWQYLSPAIFRMLLPTVKNLEKEKQLLKAQEEEKRLATERTDSTEKLRTDLVSAQNKLATTEEKLKASEKAKGDLETRLTNEAAKAQQQLRDELSAAKKRLAEAEEKLKTTKESLDPYGGWCPVSLGTAIRFRSSQSKKCLDFDGNTVHQTGASQSQNQKWAIDRAGPLGFFIRHVNSGRFLATSDICKQNAPYLTTHEFGCVFTFESKPDGTVWIHLADRNTHTIRPADTNPNLVLPDIAPGMPSVFGGSAVNWNRCILWPNNKDGWDSWYVKAFDDLSI